MTPQPSPSIFAQVPPQVYDYQIVSLSQWFNGDGITDRVDKCDAECVNTLCMSNSASCSASTDKIATGRIARLPLIDLRSNESFSKYHLSLDLSSNMRRNSEREEEGEANDSDGTVVHLPFGSIQSGERSCELPPRNLPFAILIPSQKVADKEDDLGKGHNRDNENEGGNHNSDEKSHTIINAVEGFFFATSSKVTGQSRKPWMVKQIIYENERMWNEAKELGILYDCQYRLKQGKNDYQRENQDVHRPLPRLWKPDQMVQSILLPLLKQKLTQTLARLQTQSQQEEQRRSEEEYHENFIHANQSLPLPSFTICDLGSGAGRDVCFLAEELNCHCRRYYHEDAPTSPISSTFPLQLTVVGIDNHKGSSKRCIPLWKNRNVSHIAKSILLDLNKIDFFRNELNQVNTINEIVCLYAIRFLNRKFLKYIAESQSKDDNNYHSDDDKDDPTSSETTSMSDDDEALQKNTLSPVNCESLIQPLLLEHGTLFAMSHFCKPDIGATWNFDHPKEKSVLERNELRDIFTVDRWRILHDEISYDSDHGRTLINFVAQRL